jgi:putative ABC transport system permease protein
MGDLKFAWRSLRTHRGVAAIAVVTLALAVGGASAIYSVTNAVVLRPLPYRNSPELVIIRDSHMPNLPSFSVSPGRFLEWQSRGRVFQSVAASQNGSANLTGAGDPERLRVAVVSPSFFETLGVAPLAGRTFRSDEVSDTSPNLVILSEGLWRSRFGAARDVVGRTIQLDDVPNTVVGVMPATFQFPAPTTQLWALWGITPEERQRYGSHYLVCFARMKPGVTVEQAREDLARASREIEHVGSGNEGWTTLVDGMQSYVVRNVRVGLWVLSGAVAILLLIACANVANLLLARGIGRQRELGLRAALGATRSRLMRQLFAENLLLGAAGGLLGLGLAWGILRGVLALTSTGPGLPRADTIALDGATLAFTLALAVLTPLLFGLVPTLQVSRADLQPLLGQGSRSGSSAMRARTRATLIVGEVALAVMLVAGSTLLLRSFSKLMAVSPGFNPDHALLVSLSLPSSKYSDLEQRARFWTDLTARVSALPGVRGAAVTQSVPLLSDYVSTLEVPGKTPDDPTRRPSTNFYAVSPGYFTTMGIPLLQGRGPAPTDTAGTPRVAVISQSLAARYFPGEDPIGQRVRVSQGMRDDFAEVIGVAGDVKQYGLDRETTMGVYEPARQHPYFSGMTLVVRTVSAAPDSLTTGVRGVVRDLDPSLPVPNAGALADVVESSVGSRRFTTTLLGAFAAVALLLSAIGVYGLVSFSVGQRTQEIGVRVALGATPRDVMRLVFGQGVRLTLAGAAVGVVFGLFASRLLETQLFEVSVRDPLAFGAAPAVLVAAAIVACFWPVRRALNVDPVVALRQQ